MLVGIVARSDSIFGRNLEAAWKAAGFTRAKDFADAIGVSPGTLGDWKAGRRKPTIPNCLMLARGAKTTIGALVVGMDAEYDTFVSGAGTTPHSSAANKDRELHADVTQYVKGYGNTPTQPLDAGSMDRGGARDESQSVARRASKSVRADPVVLSRGFFDQIVAVANEAITALDKFGGAASRPPARDAETPSPIRGGRDSDVHRSQRHPKRTGR